MKPLFACLFLFFLLTFAANTTAQEVKQTAATAAKMPTKSAASGSVAPKAAPSTAPKPATSVVKKAKKSEKSAAEKPASKGLFDDDYDGDVGIKYIGTQPASDEELARVKEIERNAKAVKPAKSAPKPAVLPAPRVEKQKMSDAKTETTPAAAKVTIAEKVQTVEIKSTSKVAEKTAPVEVKATPKAVEKAVVTEVKPEPKAVEKVQVAAVKYEAPEVKPAPKAAVKPISKSVTRGAHMEFDAMTIDLGNIKEDAVLERYFEFTNTGSSNLEILECRGSCGCIQPKAESTIVAAGERGRIYVKYVARNKVGPQKPVVTLTTNGVPSVIRLFIETWVEQIPGGVKDPNPAPVKSENNKM